MRGMQGMSGMNGSEADSEDMEIVHELLVNHQAIRRTVEELPNGIRTVTESSDPEVHAYIVDHVARMNERLEAGEMFNISSPTIPILFENRDRIHTEIEYTSTGVIMVQTSDDPETVTALQAHAVEVSEMVDEGMAAMMRSRMQSPRQPAMRHEGAGGMHERMHGGSGH